MAKTTPAEAAVQYLDLTGEDAHMDVVGPLIAGAIFEVHQRLLRGIQEFLREKSPDRNLKPWSAPPPWLGWPTGILVNHSRGLADTQSPVLVDRWLRPFSREEVLGLLPRESSDDESLLRPSTPSLRPATMEDALELSESVMDGKLAGCTTESALRARANAVLKQGRPPNMGLLAFGITARAIVRLRTPPPHDKTNVAVGLLAAFGAVEQLGSRDAAGRRWRDRFRKFDDSLVDRAVFRMAESLPGAGGLDHGLRFS